LPASPAAEAACPQGGWWLAWRARFGLAEVCGTLAAVTGFAVGYLAAGSLLAAAGLATVCEAIGFYGWLGFAVGKLAADVAWYGLEAAARRGIARSLAARAEPLSEAFERSDVIGAGN
jgi:hypothetical protein